MDSILILAIATAALTLATLWYSLEMYLQRRTGERLSGLFKQMEDRITQLDQTLEAAAAAFAPHTIRTEQGDDGSITTYSLGGRGGRR